MSRTQGKGKWGAGAGGPRREAHLNTKVDTVPPGADDDVQQGRAEEGVEVLRPLMPTLRDVALQHVWAWTTRSGQRSALTHVNVSKADAHRVQNPGWQHGHAVQAQLGHEETEDRHRHRRWVTPRQPTDRARAP